MIAFAVLFVLFTVGGLLCLAVAAVARTWIRASRSGRCKIAVIVLVVISSPYVAFKHWEHARLMERVPPPLEVARIEYRLEQAWGIGLPGDNETGFRTYRLDRESAEWARSKGSSLASSLTGRDRTWLPTPMNARTDLQPWRSKNQPAGEPFSIRRYLDRYGFSIPLEQARASEVDRAMRRPGSFYSYGRGGSLTIIDTGRGKVYFAYAG